MSNTRPIWVSIWYRNQEQGFEHDVAKRPLIIGRKFLQQLFNTNGNTFRNVSRNHLEIIYDSAKDQLWATDQSLLGTLARVVNDDNMGPEFLYHHESFLVKRSMRLRLQNEDNERQPDDVLINIENDDHEETRPILDAPEHWDKLLSQLRSLRAAHIVGVAGTGKSTLAKKLLAPDGTLWQRQRDRHLGGTALVAWVDCHLMHNAPIWQTVGRRMLSALQTAADERGLFELRDELRDAVNYFNGNVRTRIGQMNAVFRGALRLVAKAGLRPLFVFDHFDGAFAQIDPFMLYQLYQFHQWPEIGESLRYLVITRRPLEMVRDDIETDGVNEFVSLFGRTALRLTPVNSDEFRKLWREVAPPYGFVSAENLSGLYKLCGGHPALTRELYQELALNGWLDDAPKTWDKQLRRLDWRERPSQSAVTLWQSLNEVEQHTVLASLTDAPSDKHVELALRSAGLFNRRGELFSPIFRDTVLNQRDGQPLPTQGLYVMPERQRVLLNGEDVTGKLSGRKLDVLMYLHENAGRLCTYNELIENTLAADVALDELLLEMERGSLQRTVSRLCRIVDPKRKYIFNEQGRGYLLRI